MTTVANLILNYTASSSQGHSSSSRPIQPPPQNPQQFGQGAPSDYSFQYSQCTGRRKALLIGINYFGQRGQLRGCINDVRNMTSYLSEHFGYRREDMVILTDDQQNPMSQPTKQNILRAMHWLVKDARPNDSLFFHYSGHGGQTKDLDGDEPDGYDEVIYPVDFRQRGHITDDEMHRIMVQPLQAGVRLTAIFDSCHSGTALDLPYIYSTQGILKEPNLAKEAGQGLLGAINSYSQGDLGGVASSLGKFFKRATSGDDAYERSLATKTSPADVIMLSGSKDDQTSYAFPLLAVFPSHANKCILLQRRRNHCLASYRRHVVGLCPGPQEEPAPELRPAAQLDPRRAREEVYPEAAALLQSPSQYVLFRVPHHLSLD